MSIISEIGEKIFVLRSGINVHGPAKIECVPRAIYVGHKEFVDMRTNVTTWQISTKDGRMTVQGVPVFEVDAESYLHVAFDLPV